jgi:hypothetical protein
MPDKTTTPQPFYTCPTCGGHDLPPVLASLLNEWIAADFVLRERVLLPLLKALHLHGEPSGRGWNGAIGDVVREVLPHFPDAWAEHGRSATGVLGLFDDEPDAPEGGAE